MSCLEEMQRFRCALDTALERRADATRAGSAQQRKLIEIRRQLESRREEMLAERIAAAAASVEATSSAAELQDLQLDIEAAEEVARQLERTQEEANALCERAEQAWRKSVCKFAQAQEAIAVSEIDGILESLGQACARGIAAAKVSSVDAPFDARVFLERLAGCRLLPSVRPRDAAMGCGPAWEFADRIHITRACSIAR